MTRSACDIVDVYAFRRGSMPPPALSSPGEGKSTHAGNVEFLMLRRAPGRYLGGTWQAVHGRIEPGETAWQAALRELREETGLAPTAFYQIDTVNTFYMVVDDTVHHCPCFAAEVAPDAEVALNEEHIAYEWVSSDQAVGRFIWPGQRPVREILDEIIRPGPAIDYLRIAIGPQAKC